jgi:transposase
LSERQWAVLEPLIPTNRRGVKPKRNREIISGIVHILKVGCRWRDCPEVYGPHTTIYNRFNRWSKDGIWQRCTAVVPVVWTGSGKNKLRPVAG